MSGTLITGLASSQVSGYESGTYSIEEVLDWYFIHHKKGFMLKN